MTQLDLVSKHSMRGGLKLVNMVGKRNEQWIKCDKFKHNTTIRYNFLKVKCFFYPDYIREGGNQGLNKDQDNGLREIGDIKVGIRDIGKLKKIDMSHLITIPNQMN